ncbi:hypothetical protein [Elioraea sp.]|uniref:hypothetical protein n=1 Tax=Elioraea sp. TaxID=2185103 RepID=UPI0025C57A2F|nr:hypothetical protein [Elioraea sp.]
MAATSPRNRLLPWFIGLLVIIAAAVAGVWVLYAGGCAAPAMVVVIALVVMPAVYLALMYLTLTSQA